MTGTADVGPFMAGHADATSRRWPPYQAQWASPELVGDILRGTVRAQDDPRWRESGAADPDEYAFWSWRACGMAALRSWLATSIDPTGLPGPVALAREVEAAGGYRVRPDGTGVDGLIYAPFVDYLAARWSLRAAVAAPLTLDELAAHVRGGGAVLASVAPEIRSPERPTAKRGGHLVLVFDVADDGVLVFHNPSGDTPATQAAVPLPSEPFSDFFAGRGVMLWRPGTKQ